ncbi:hypothetical protein [Demequina oxidasica]|uniref:hypothetical protein n=1 Tax=Demequina oxidasica TaxID=676199 RepID=UPI000A6FCDFB|nr:hypothetical protein [Demequina oxidasica]
MSGTSGPVAGRLKRPSWRDPRLLIGLVLIAVAVVAVSASIRASDSTEPYYTAIKVLTPGTEVSESDVAVTRVRVAPDVYVSAQGDPPWGQVVTRVIGEGELLPTDAVTGASEVDVRAVAVRTQNPLAQDIESGSVVDVWLTTGNDGSPVSTPVAEGLIVSQVEQEDSAFTVGAAQTVYVLVPQDSMSDFLGAVATEGEISIVGRAAGGEG